MSSNRPFSAIPSLQGVRDQTLLKVLTPIKEDIERVLGLNGKQEDLFIRASDAKKAIGEAIEYIKDEYNEPPVLPIPIIEETDITATGTYERIILSWNVPYNYWLAHYEILRSSTNVVGTAVVIGSTTSMVYSDPVGPAKTYYYWIRIVQKKEAGGESGALPTEGKEASTVDDPSHLLNVLNGHIAETQLYADLAARIDLIDAAASVAGSVNARDAVLQVAIDNNATAIAAIDTRVTANEGNISSHATAILALQATTDDLSIGVAANASAVSSLDTRVTANEGNISSHASSISQISTTVGNHTTSIETNASSIDGLEGQYTVKIDANGKVIGYGLASGDPDSADSSFIVRADKFAFCLPTGEGGDPVIPFAIGEIAGEPTVGINGQLVIDGSLVTRCFAANSVTADIISVDNLAAISANMGEITGGSMNIANGAFRIYENGNVDINAGTVQSTNYVAGVSGYRFTRTGALDITSLNCIGTANIKDLNVSTAKIADLACSTAKIANLAVTEGKIANLAVDTLKIKDDAVTVPVSSFTSGSISISETSETTVAQCSIAVAGFPVHIIVSVTSELTGGDAGGTMIAYLYRGSTLLWSATVQKTSGATPITDAITYQYNDSPSNGTYTYYFKMKRTDGGSGDGNGSATNRSMLVLGIQK